MIEMTEALVQALQMKYRAQMEEARVNIVVYMKNPVGIGEHPEIIEAIDTQVAKFAEAQERLAALDDIING
jgi:hypothetical protein